ncbi:MAG: glycoside hydrolase family 127 protein, partial [Clostridia bacterium]|nr:glycoside hydrolase family 127 protein [Clostridia bacterium]
GKKERLTLCQAFADKLLQTDFCITGASGGRDEYFNNSTKMQVVKNDIHKFETCVTVTLMKYFASLYRATGEKKYLDAIERSFYNAYLGAMNYEKNNGYYPVPLFYSYSPVYNNVRWTLVGGAKNLAPYASFGCCIAIGAAGVGVLPTVGFVQDRDCFTLGLFIDGEYEFPSAKFRVETEYPNGGTVKITLLKSASEIRLKLRIPDWCDHVSLDKEYGTENGFAVLQKPLREGDSVVYKMDMSFKVTASQSVNPSVTDLFSISYGPNVLCADSLETDLNKPYRLQMKDGYVQVEKTEIVYALNLVDGGTISMRNYRVTGKDYYEPRAISVWLKKGDDGR